MIDQVIRGLTSLFSNIGQGFKQAANTNTVIDKVGKTIQDTAGEVAGGFFDKVFKDIGTFLSGGEKPVDVASQVSGMTSDVRSKVDEWTARGKKVFGDYIYSIPEYKNFVEGYSAYSQAMSQIPLGDSRYDHLQVAPTQAMMASTDPWRHIVLEAEKEGITPGYIEQKISSLGDMLATGVQNAIPSFTGAINGGGGPVVMEKAVPVYNTSPMAAIMPAAGGGPNWLLIIGLLLGGWFLLKKAKVLK